MGMSVGGLSDGAEALVGAEKKSRRAQKWPALAGTLATSEAHLKGPER